MKEQVLVIGMGVSGKAAAELCLAKKIPVTGYDDKAFNQDDQRFLAERGCAVIQAKETLKLDQFTKVVVSPGVPAEHPLVVQAREMGLKVVGEMEFALSQLHGHKVLGITGTNGKTTVTLLVEHILVSCGYKAKALGNVGTPLSAALLQLTEGQILVLELSSYQIETLEAKALHAAVILNITPDHLDRYVTMEAYAAAKCKLQHNLLPCGSFFVFEDVARDYGHLLSDGYVTYGIQRLSQYVLEALDVKKGQECVCSLPGCSLASFFHDKMNAMAAWLLCGSVGVRPKDFGLALTTFAKPDHRLQHVKTVLGVDYIDDSKGTNIDAVVQAVHAMKKPVILIAGGVDKGSSYLPWRTAFEGRVKKLIVIGQAKDKIDKELGPFFAVEKSASLQDAVNTAASLAKEGDAVVLSPGCSSFDMFRDYVHRGQEFQKYVNLLKE